MQIVKDYISHLIPGDQFCLVDEDYFTNLKSEMDGHQLYFIKSYPHLKNNALTHVGIVAVDPAWPEDHTAVPTPYVIEFKKDEEVCLSLPPDPAERGLDLGEVYYELAELADPASLPSLEGLPDDLQQAMLVDVVASIVEERLDALYREQSTGTALTAKTQSVIDKLMDITPNPNAPNLNYGLIINAINEDGTEEPVNIADFLKEIAEMENEDLDFEYEEDEE